MADTRKGGGTHQKKDGRGRSNRPLVTAATAGAAIGIGSAALVAALLYANRSRDEEVATPVDPRFAPDDS